jgi:hypothetical protein
VRELKSEPHAVCRVHASPEPSQRLPIKAGGSAWENDVTAYLIVGHKITDPAKFEEYRTKVGPVIAKHGGRYLTKGGTHKVVKPPIGSPIESPSLSSPMRRLWRLGTIRQSSNRYWHSGAYRWTWTRIC